MQKIIYIAMFGAAGAVTRYLSNRICVRLLGGGFAYSTVIVNVVGCFLIGLFMALESKHPRTFSDATHTAIVTGFLGALTTFSAFSFETVSYFQDSRPTAAFLNIAANLLLGLLAAWSGMLVGK